MEKLDLGWGDPHFLLEILSGIYTPRLGGPLLIRDMTYSTDIGEKKLLEHVERITEQTTGNKYKYYLITNGATQAINSIMRVWSDNLPFHGYGITSKLGYPYYPHMINKNSDLEHKKVDIGSYKPNQRKDIMIIDSPSNPYGEQFARNTFANTIWDAVYHNPIYNACPAIQPRHDAYVGSFSKLLGLTGARVGWIATNSEDDFQDFTADALYENATVSKISQHFILNILETIDLNQFMRFGRNSLDQNRAELQKLARITGVDVQEKGMFYCFEADDKLFDLFDRADITYVRLNDGNNDLIRLNIGQSNDIIKKAVERILLTDRRK